MVALDIKLFQHFSCQYEGQPVAALDAPRLHGLLSYLLLHRGKAISRTLLGYHLWPELPEAKARANLSNIWYRMKRAFPSIQGYVEVNKQQLQWREDTEFSLDTERFSVHLKEAEEAKDATARCAALQAAVDLYRGPLLQDFCEEWVISHRQAFASQLIGATHALAEEYLRVGALSDAIATVQRLLVIEPLNEPAIRLLMQMYARQGRAAKAIEVYLDFARELDQLFEVDPEQETWQLYEQIADRDISSSQEQLPALADVHAQVAVLHEPHRDAYEASIEKALPAMLSAVIGRASEQAQIKGQLAAPEVRLLTIVGLGGSGKTTLALHLAHELRNEGQPVLYVRLGDISAAEQIPSSLRAALGIEVSQDDPMEQVCACLQHKPLLLVLDNFEHVMGGAPCLTVLLQRAPQVKILVTSRLPLRQPGEWVLELDGLPMGEDDADAVSLFLHCARQQNAIVPDSPEAMALVVAICRVLEGLPLGIELAASWLKMLSLDEILRALQEDAPWLTTMSTHHRKSLQHVFETSWTLLSAEQRELLQRLSLFRNAFGLQETLAVTGSSMQDLFALRDHSMLKRDTQGQCHLHELIRQFAARQLAGNEALSVDAHERCWQHLCDLLARQMPSPGTRDWPVIEQLRCHLETLKILFHWAIEHIPLDELFTAVSHLTEFLLFEGRYQEGATLFAAVEKAFGQTHGRMLTKAAKTTEEGRQCHRLAARLKRDEGVFWWYLGQTQRYTRNNRQALALLEGCDAPDEEARTLYELGSSITADGAYDEAFSLLQRSLALSLEHGPTSLAMESYCNLGYVCLYQSRYDEGEAFFREGLALPNVAAHPTVGHMLRLHLGMLKLRTRSYREARKLLFDCLADNEAQTLVARAVTHAVLGLAHSYLGDMQKAKVALQESLHEFRSQPSALHAWVALDGLARLACMEGQYHTAQAAVQKLIAHIEGYDTVSRIRSQALATRGYIACQLGQTDDAKAAFQEGLLLAHESNNIEPLREHLIGLAALTEAREEREALLSCAGSGVFGLFDQWAAQIAESNDTAIDLQLTHDPAACFALSAQLI